MLKKFELRMIARDDELDTVYEGLVEANSLIELATRIPILMAELCNECADYERSKHDDETAELPF